MSNPHTEKELRSEFQEWIEEGVWQGEDEYTKNFAVGNIADWWLAKLKEQEAAYKQSLLEKVEKMRKSPANERYEYVAEIHNTALDTCIDLINEDTKE